MKIAYLTLVAVLTTGMTCSAFAAESDQPATQAEGTASAPQSMPMPACQRDGMGMMQGHHHGKMNPQMMQQNMLAMREHMTTVDQHLANIEALLKELVQLQKTSARQ